VLQRGWADRRWGRFGGNRLRAGVLMAEFIVFLGAICDLAQEGNGHTDYGKFQGGPPALERVGEIAVNALKLDGKALVQFGLLVLIGTPVARVILLVFAF